MRSIGFPELLVILGTVLLTALPAIATGVVVWFALRGRRRGWTIPARPCPHCSQQIPNLGSYCPICGGRIPPG